jgi:hypothetical protein
MRATQVPTIAWFVALATGFPTCELPAQKHDQHAQTQRNSGLTENQDLVREILALRDKVAQMEARAKELGWMGAKKGMGMGMGAKKGMGMGAKKGMGMGMGAKKGMGMGMGAKKGMGMGMGAKKGMGMGMGAKKGMGMGAKQGMAKMGRMAKMGAMARKNAMGKMGMAKDMAKMGAGGASQSRGATAAESATNLIAASSEPGLPGVSHALHVGATGFFLDHAEHLQLTAPQAKQLAKIQQASALAKSTFDRRLAEAEQQLWSLTGAETPSLDAIRRQTKTIADLGAEKRMAFIQSVVKAVEVLTPSQHKLLLGEDIPEADAKSDRAGK